MDAQSMNKAIVWSQQGCQYCDTTIALLKARGCEVEERKIATGKWTKKDLLDEVPSARSVPQIFIDGKHIGGYNDLVNILQ